MKKKYYLSLFIIAIIICNFLFFANNSFSYSLKDTTGFFQQTGAATGLKTTELSVIIGTLITAVLGLAGIAFVVLFIYGGILWMTSSGKEDQIKKAKNILIYAAIGLVIVVGAYAITYFVSNAIEQSTSATATK